MGRGIGAGKLPKLIIFDLDGTIIDSEPVAMEAWIKAGEEFGVTIQKEDLLPMIGVNEESNRRMMLDRFGGNLPFKAMLERVREITKQSYQEGVPVKEGVKELLDLLEDFGIRRCIATSSRKTRSEDILSRIGLLREFEFLLSGEEITHSKPHPEIFELAMARMGIPSTSTMIVEDSKNGILAAKASGAISVLIPDLLPVDAIMKENADLIFNSLLDLKDYLLELE